MTSVSQSSLYGIDLCINQKIASGALFTFICIKYSRILKIVSTLLVGEYQFLFFQGVIKALQFQALHSFSLADTRVIIENANITWTIKSKQNLLVFAKQTE